MTNAWKLLITLLLTLGLLAILHWFYTPTVAKERPERELLGKDLILTTLEAQSTIPEPKKPSLGLPPSAVARCESRTGHWDANGNVVIGITGDIGKWQISPIHLPEATSLGIDVYTLEGNDAFARILYRRSGLKPWRSSISCWLPLVTAGE